MSWKNYAKLAAEYLNPTTGRTYPGKFEGQTLLAPYFHSGTLDDPLPLEFMEDGEGRFIALLEITNEDRAFFAGTENELPSDSAFALIHETEQGFVSCELCTLAEAEAIREAYDEDNGESE